MRAVLRNFLPGLTTFEYNYRGVIILLVGYSYLMASANKLAMCTCIIMGISMCIVAVITILLSRFETNSTA